jgi:hypothetical protein
MIHVWPLGTEVLLPAFVVGYELPLPEGDPEQLQGLPDWVVTIHQQAGGLAMSYPSVVGAVLRLDANRDRGKKDLAHLIRGLRCMAEGSDLGMLRRDYPLLRRLVQTSGRDYTKDQLRDLGNLLTANLWMPPLRGGLEAFLRLAPCNPLDYFRDWKLLRCAPRRVTDTLTGEERIGSHSQEAPHFDDGNLSELDLADASVYDEGCQGQLTALGAVLGANRLPDAFFLWENSD